MEACGADLTTTSAAAGALKAWSLLDGACKCARGHHHCCGCSRVPGGFTCAGTPAEQRGGAQREGVLDHIQAVLISSEQEEICLLWRACQMHGGCGHSPTCSTFCSSKPRLPGSTASHDLSGHWLAEFAPSGGQGPARDMHCGWPSRVPSSLMCPLRCSNIESEQTQLPDKASRDLSAPDVLCHVETNPAAC